MLVTRGVNFGWWMWNAVTPKKNHRKAQSTNWCNKNFDFMGQGGEPQKLTSWVVVSNYFLCSPLFMVKRSNLRNIYFLKWVGSTQPPASKALVLPKNISPTCRFVFRVHGVVDRKTVTSSRHILPSYWTNVQITVARRKKRVPGWLPRLTRWWFQRFFMFTPILGEMI